MSRYSRQHILPGFGKAAQEKLRQAKILVVGAGGLGCPALLHLAAAGVGHIAIADGDVVSESNLNRQTLFGHKDLGKPKAETAARHLRDKYPDLHFELFPEFLTNQNALDIIEEFDLVLDGSDNFGTRYMVNDACVLLGKPLVMGAIYQYEGQVSVFNFGEGAVQYRDLYPDPPGQGEIPNCSETGVIGVVPGIIGTLQAGEAIKVLTGVGKPLSGRLLLYDFRSAEFQEMALAKNPAAGNALPTSREEFENRDYSISCGLAESISWDKALDWLEKLESTALIDIRETGEKSEIKSLEAQWLPMSELRKNTDPVKPVENLLLFCQSGERSLLLAQELKRQFPEKKIFSVEGGILHPSSPLNKH